MSMGNDAVVFSHKPLNAELGERFVSGLSADMKVRRHEGGGYEVTFYPPGNEEPCAIFQPDDVGRWNRVIGDLEAGEWTFFATDFRAELSLSERGNVRIKFPATHQQGLFGTVEQMKLKPLEVDERYDG